MFVSEQALATSFIQTAPTSVWTRESSKLQYVCSALESTCSDGRADWVWASSDRCWTSLPISQTADLLQNPTCSRIISAVRRLRKVGEDELQYRVGSSWPTFRRCVQQLSDAGLLGMSARGEYRIGSALRIPRVEIVAFEFKLKNWKRAFYQATRYRSFAHRVFVVMPGDAAVHALKNETAFRTQNIGLISHDSFGTKRLLPSLKRNPKSGSAFVQAIGMLTTQA